MEIKNIFPTAVSRSEWSEALSEKQLSWIKLLPRHMGSSHMLSDDTNVLNNIILSNLREWIEDEIMMYYEFVLGASVKPYITQSWVNYTDEGMHTHAHNHPNSIVSGVYYISANDYLILHNYEGLLYQFSENITEWNSNRSNIETKANTLLMFPSNTIHSVDSHKGDQRISIAFNTYVKGTLGKKENLTQLEI